jgi:hypothetical protein
VSDPELEAESLPRILATFSNEVEPFFQAISTNQSRGKALAFPFAWFLVEDCVS